MLQGDRVTIRALEYDDLETIWKWQNDLAVMDQLWIDPTSLRALQKEYEDQLEDSKTKQFIIENNEDGEPVGLIWYYSMRPYKSCEIGIYLGVPRLCGKGYGSDAITTFLAFLFSSKGLHRVGLSVSARNERAIAAYEKCGFKREGVTREFAWMHGEYVDLVEMGILRREFEGRD